VQTVSFRADIAASRLRLTSLKRLRLFAESARNPDPPTYLGVFDCRRIDDPAMMSSVNPAHLYEIRPRKDKRGVDLISDALPFGRLCYGGPNAASNAVSYAMHYSRSYDAVIRVYDVAGNVIEKREHKGDFKEP
jgi:hypothetical protein